MIYVQLQYQLTIIVNFCDHLGLRHREVSPEEGMLGFSHLKVYINESLIVEAINL